jgi:syntaxin-binding protein 5
MDRENLASLRLPNFWAEQNPRARTLPVISLQFHPRDIGTLLIGYPEGAAIYSFKLNKALKFFHYHVPRGAPGGDSNPASLSIDRNPKLLHSAWHPTGQFVITGHDDGSMVFWDTKSGQMILARTLTDTNVDKEGAGATTFGGTNGTDPKTPLLKIVWCAHQDPDDTGILIAGGTSTLLPMKGLTFLELGRTPTYVTSSWQILSEHFAEPKRQRVLPTPPSLEVVDFCLIPRKSPWFAGAHDPIAVVALLSSGEVTSLSFPSGYPISPTNQLPISVSMLHPFGTVLAHSPIDRSRWLGMSENRQSGPKMLNGGTDTVPPMRHHEQRNVIISAHADGVVRAWDIGHEDEIENKSVSQADVARAVGRLDGVQITQLSLASTSGELAVGLRSGELVVFRWARNSNPGREPPTATANKADGLTNVTSRVDPALIEGFQPFTLLDKRNGSCTALHVSNVGFVAAGFEGGAIVVVDLRGPAIIFDGSIQDFTESSSKASPLRRKSTPAMSSYATTVQFSVMTLEGESYSSILLHIGTNTGVVATLKILPGQGGRYSVAPAGSTTVTGRVKLIHPLNASSINAAYATPQAVASLRDGFKVDGALLVVTDNEARIFRPASAKGAHNSFSNILCLSAAVANYQGRGLALVGLFGDGTTRAFSIPGLKELASARLDGMLDVRRFQDAIVTNNGDVIGWTGPSEIAVVNIWGMPAPK